MKFDAIVIGAGPGGTSAALALAKEGRSVAIIERARFPRRKVCGEFMSAVNLELLDRLGVGAEMRTLAGPQVKRLALFASGRAVEAEMPCANGEAYGRALGRDVLDTMLLQAAGKAGATIFQPWSAAQISPQGDGSAVRIETRGDTRTLTAPVVIAAHGSWEPGNLPSHLEKHNRPRDFLGFKAHFTGASLAPDLMPLLAFPGGYGGMVWADQGHLSLSLCVRRDALAKIRASRSRLSAAEAVADHVVASCPAAAAVLSHATLHGKWLAAGPIRPGIRPCYDSDIFRVGNLAGESHPVIAEGISMALQSGWILARHLAACETWDQAERIAAGRGYTTVWRKQFTTRIHAASALARMATVPQTATLMQAVVSAVPASLSLGAMLSGKVKALQDVSN